MHASLANSFTSNVFNMFRTLINLSPVACDYSVELPYWWYFYVKAEDLALSYIMICCGVCLM